MAANNTQVVVTAQWHYIIIIYLFIMSRADSCWRSCFLYSAHSLMFLIRIIRISFSPNEATPKKKKNKQQQQQQNTRYITITITCTCDNFSTDKPTFRPTNNCLLSSQLLLTRMLLLGLEIVFIGAVDPVMAVTETMTCKFCLSNAPDFKSFLGAAPPKQWLTLQMLLWHATVTWCCDMLLWHAVG